MSLAATYQQTAVSTQSRGRLIVMLYDGAIKFLKLALVGIESKNYADKGNSKTCPSELSYLFAKN